MNYPFFSGACQSSSGGRAPARFVTGRCHELDPTPLLPRAKDSPPPVPPEIERSRYVLQFLPKAALIAQLASRRGNQLPRTGSSWCFALISP